VLGIQGQKQSFDYDHTSAMDEVEQIEQIEVVLQMESEIEEASECQIFERKRGEGQQPKSL
jgi:hypothetical protein